MEQNDQAAKELVVHTDKVASETTIFSGGFDTVKREWNRL
jgi:hypothetical protein